MPYLRVASRPRTLIAFDKPIVHLKVDAATMRTMRNRSLQIFEHPHACDCQSIHDEPPFVPLTEKRPRRPLRQKRVQKTADDSAEITRKQPEGRLARDLMRNAEVLDLSRYLLVLPYVFILEKG